MSFAFSRSMRSLQADRFRPTAVALLAAAVLFVAWLMWFLLSRLAIYEVSSAARLEVEEAVHPVQAPVTGRVVRTLLILDRLVEAGDLLMELEAADQELRLGEERARMEALSAQLETLRGEIRVNEQALDGANETGRLVMDEGRAELRAAAAAARFALEDAERTELLYNQGLKSEVDLLRANSEVEQTQAAVERHQVAISRLEEEWVTQERDRRTELERLQRVANQLAGAIATSEATMRRLELDVEERLIRAPVRGRLGEVSDLQVGGHVEVGDQLCAVVPEGEPRVVAEFQPHDALGRVRPGQPARLRLDGFPWIQYGTVAARVARVASETRDGTVRVELVIEPDPASAIPLEHGLPGRVEIEVENVTPATLLLRIVGGMVTGTDGRGRAGGPAQDLHG
jgi:multidrug resistance efflux pump